jgi:hypothetical protein
MRPARHLNRHRRKIERARTRACRHGVLELTRWLVTGGRSQERTWYDLGSDEYGYRIDVHWLIVHWHGTADNPEPRATLVDLNRKKVEGESVLSFTCRIDDACQFAYTRALLNSGWSDARWRVASFTWAIGRPRPLPTTELVP